eukprot:1155087-Prorocentrum_minimum.AAC.1
MGKKEDDFDKVLKPDYMCTVFLTSAPYPKASEESFVASNLCIQRSGRKPNAVAEQSTLDS